MDECEEAMTTGSSVYDETASNAHPQEKNHRDERAYANGPCYCGPVCLLEDLPLPSPGEYEVEDIDEIRALESTYQTLEKYEGFLINCLDDCQLRIEEGAPLGQDIIDAMKRFVIYAKGKGKVDEEEQLIARIQVCSVVEVEEDTVNLLRWYCELVMDAGEQMGRTSVVLQKVRRLLRRA